MKQKSIFVILGMLVAFVPSSPADPIVLATAGVSVVVPDHWEWEQAGGTFEARSPDGEMTMYAWTEQAVDVQSSLEGVYTSFAEIVEGFETFTRGKVLWEGYSEEPTDVDRYYIGGLGKVGDEVVDCGLALVDSGDIVAVVIVFFDGYDEKVTEHHEIGESILTSIRVIR